MVRNLSRFLFVLVAVLVMAMLGCAKKDVVQPPDENSDIPKDPPAGSHCPPTQFNNLIPSATFSLTAENKVRIRLNLLGLVNPSTGQPLDVQPANVCVEEDGILQGIKVTTPTNENRLMADVVFVVDNSGSMGEEADSIASRIIAFAHELTTRNIDVRVGCVGHGLNSDGFVYGALNLTTADSLDSYLNRFSGVYRTVGFAGQDSAALYQSAANMGSYAAGENSVIGIRYADQSFRWRVGANRLYVAFTDEPTQPGGDSTFTTANFLADWQREPIRGTVHMVFSQDSTAYTWQDGFDERPWALALGTGGSIKFVAFDASDLDLTTLQVTGSIGASRLVEFVTANPNGVHDLIITIKTAQADGRRSFTGITYGSAGQINAASAARRPMPVVTRPTFMRQPIADPRPR